MGVDAVAVLRPKPKTEKAFRREADSLQPLDDGNFMLNTLMSYAWFESEPEEARAYLETAFGRPLAEIHDDERGVLMFPDAYEPRATTYDGIVAEIMKDGGALWIPLDDSPAARERAKNIAAEQAKAAEARRLERGDVFSKFKDSMSRASPDGEDADEILAELNELSDAILDIRPGTNVWCVLVRRKTRIAQRDLAHSTNEVVVLRDGSTAIYTTMIEDLDSLAWRLSDEYGAWRSEHEDERGIPAFGADDLDKIRGARSYEDAVRRLGKAIQWVVPKGLREREKERKKKVRALLGRATKKAPSKKAAPKKKTAKKAGNKRGSRH